MKRKNHTAARPSSWFKRPSLSGIAAAAAGAAGAVFVVWSLSGNAPPPASLPPDGPILAPAVTDVFHDQFVDIRLTVPSPGLRAALAKRELWIWVERDGARVPTVGGTEKLRLRFDDGLGAWQALWPCPWNAPDGEYQVRMDTAPFAAEGAPAPRAEPFRVVSRPFEPVTPGLGVLTLEDLGGLGNIVSPDGTRRGAAALVDWVEFMGADALMVQGAESSGYQRKLPAEFPWYTRPEKDIRALGRECHARGLKFGVYLLCFLVGGPPENTPDYAYGWDYREGRLLHGPEMKTRRGISITDPKRAQDIVNMLKVWRDMEEVDIIGLDYIRPVFGGYELAMDFASKMPVDPPPGWDGFSEHQRMLWLAKTRLLPPTLEMRGVGNYKFIDKWFWYRAHRSAQVVRAIKAGVGDQKPLWAFTLSWEKGWQHGQDPVMMRDAGIDMDAIMLYEANTEQFGALVKQWNDYVKQSEVNLVVGDVVDWNLHQKTMNPAGPEDFYNRNMKAVKEFHADKPVRGLFIHDFTRARRGRIAPYTMKEWLLAGGAAITSLRSLHKKLPYELSLSFPDAVAPGASAQGRLSFAGAAKGGAVVELSAAPDVRVEPARIELTPESPSASFTVRYAPDGRSAARGFRSFVAARMGALRCGRRQIYMKYFQGKKPPAAETSVPPVKSTAPAGTP
jgi:hypothetical protein